MAGSGDNQPGWGEGHTIAKHASRIPSGHPEGYLEAFAQLYTDLAEQIAARNEGRTPVKAALLVPGVKEGVEGCSSLRECSPLRSRIRAG